MSTQTPHTVSIIGTGYAGLVTGACLAEQGHQVICVDRHSQPVDRINSGQAPFFEPGLQSVVSDLVNKGRLRATCSLAEAVAHSSISIVAVGTPAQPQSDCDLSQVLSAIDELAEEVRGKNRYHIVAIKSSVVPGTTDTALLPRLEKKLGPATQGNFGLCVNPEFLREGSALSDSRRPDRIVIGSLDHRSEDGYSAIFDWAECPVLKTDFRTAELIKYASNALLGLLISYSNEMASIAEAMGQTQIEEVFRGVAMDGRWRPSAIRNNSTNPALNTYAPGILEYLWPGCGFGGGCLPKDIQALRHQAASLDIETPLLDGILRINRSQIEKLIRWSSRALGSLRDKRLTILGVSFKPRTDDIRDSPALHLVSALLAEGAATVTLCDPRALPNARLFFGSTSVCYEEDPEKALQGRDCAYLMTAWNDFRTLTPQIFLERMRTPCLVDGRLFFDGPRFEKAGVTYISYGRSSLTGRTKRNGAPEQDG